LIPKLNVPNWQDPLGDGYRFTCGTAIRREGHVGFVLSALIADSALSTFGSTGGIGLAPFVMLELSATLWEYGLARLRKIRKLVSGDNRAAVSAYPLAPVQGRNRREASDTSL
jgi:hypothetical protein